MRQMVLLAVAFLLSPVLPVLGQEPLSIQPMAKIRVTLEAPVTPKEGATVKVTPTVGTLVDLTVDSLSFRLWNTSLVRTVSIDRISRLETSRPGPTKGLKGFLWGASIGSAIGLVEYATCQGEIVCGVLTPILAGVGGGIGALIGFSMSSDRWEEVPLNGTRIGVVPRDGGVAVCASVTF
jgi:hypothetical protein